MSRLSGPFLALILTFSLSSGMIHAAPSSGQAVQPAEKGSENSIQYHGYEAVVGVTSRAQALLVFEGTGDKKLAVMTGDFVPSPQIFLTTPFRPFTKEKAIGGKTSRTGYYYGTKVEGDFFAVAPVIATEMLRPDGTVKFRLELGLGLGYLDLSGDIVLGDQQGDPMAPSTRIDYSGPSFFLFTMGRHHWGLFMLGYQMGISATTSKPYSYSQSYISLDIGYRVVL